MSAPLLVGGARRLVRQRTRRHRGHPPSFATTGVGRLVLPRPAASADGHRRSAFGRLDFRATAAGNGSGRGHGSVLREDAPLNRWRPSRPIPATVGRFGTFSGVPRSQVTATPCGGEPLGLVSTAAKRNARMPQGTRAAKVDALGVSAAATGVVWARDPDCCRADAPLLRERAETNSDGPLRVGSRALLQSPHGDSGFNNGLYAPRGQR